jgi:hypothetical protein
MLRLRSRIVVNVTRSVRRPLESKRWSSTTTSTPQLLIEECLQIRSSVQNVNDKFRGPLEKSAQKNTLLPFVFLLGNHSSGKSSFVNYVCQRKVQTSGVAPTDDSFTVIVPGPADMDRDGPAFIGDPDMGFSGLRSFGPHLIHHTQLKVRRTSEHIDHLKYFPLESMYVLHL